MNFRISIEKIEREGRNQQNQYSFSSAATVILGLYSASKIPMWKNLKEKVSKKWPSDISSVQAIQEDRTK